MTETGNSWYSLFREKRKYDNIRENFEHQLPFHWKVVTIELSIERLKIKMKSSTIKWPKLILRRCDDDSSTCRVIAVSTICLFANKRII
jgi:hypothetical protein